MELVQGTDSVQRTHVLTDLYSVSIEVVNFCHVEGQIKICNVSKKTKKNYSKTYNVCPALFHLSLPLSLEPHVLMWANR